MLLPEKSIPYKSFVKTALVDALREQFRVHPDASLRRTKVSVDYPNTANKYPTVIVRFFEREIKNIGVGHVEFLEVGENWLTAGFFPPNDTLTLSPQMTTGTPVVPGPFLITGVQVYEYPFKHFIYNGDIEFAILALSSQDRDLISDALITTLAMSGPTLDGGTPSDFFKRIYSPIFDFDPGDDVDPWRYNFVNLNTDRIAGFGETQNPAPWMTEDQLQYQSSYRVGVMGEFYSLPPIVKGPTGPILHINLLPYIEDLEPIPIGKATVAAYNPPVTSIPIPGINGTENDPAPWE